MVAILRHNLTMSNLYFTNKEVLEAFGVDAGKEAAESVVGEMDWQSQ